MIKLTGKDIDVSKHGKFENHLNHIYSVHNTDNRI